MTTLTDKCVWLAENLLGWKRHRLEFDGTEHWKAPPDENGVACFMNPPVDLPTYQGMGEIIEAMRERGYYMDIWSNAEYSPPYGARVRLHECDVVKLANTAPSAVVETVYAALNDE